MEMKKGGRRKGIISREGTYYFLKILIHLAEHYPEERVQLRKVLEELNIPYGSSLISRLRRSACNWKEYIKLEYGLRAKDKKKVSFVSLTEKGKKLYSCLKSLDFELYDLD